MRQDARSRQRGGRRGRPRLPGRAALAATAVAAVSLGPAVPADAAEGLDASAAQADAAAALTLTAPRAQVWEHDGARVVLLRGLDVPATAAEAGAGGRVTLRIGRRAFTGREALVRLTPRPGGGFNLTAALADPEGRSAAGGSVTAEAPLRVTATIGAGVRLDAASLASGPPDGGVPARLEAVLRDAPREPRSAATPVTAAERRRSERRTGQVADDRAALLATPAPGEAASGGRLSEEAAREADAEAARPRPDAGVLPADGVVAFDAPRITAEPRGDEGGSVLTMQGGVKLQYENLGGGAGGERVVTLAAERAVVFTRDAGGQAAAPGGESLDAGGVEGVYLEGAVEVSDGDLAVRGSRVYYDVAGNRAVLLDAVMYRVDPGQDTPLAVRAGVLRQTAERSFTAERATLTTTSFARPAVAVGVDRVDVRAYETRGGREGVAVDARGLTLRAGGVPVFWLPRVAGRGTAVPLRSVSAGYSENDGVRFRTVWDGFGLLGLDAPGGVDGALTLGVRGEHGPEVGADLSWAAPDRRGRGFLRSYALPLDHGEDDLPNRPDVEHDGDFRGHAAVGHRQALANNTTLTLGAASSSDPTHYESFFRNLAYAAPADEAAAFLQQRAGDTSASLLVAGRIDPFLGQLVPLQTFGYTVDRLPEAELATVGRSLDGAGRVLWFQETRGGVLRARGDRTTPGSRGFEGDLAPAVFGIDAGDAFENALRDRGVPDDAVARFDSRQELQAPVRLGGLTATPFAVGRVTAYDTDFDAFNGGTGEAVRAWGQAGLRLNARAQRTLTTAGSGVLDVDGLRHVIEPHATGAFAWTNVNAEDLPVFDPLVEDLASGGQLALGVRNTLETRRGPRQSNAPGAPAWSGGRTVDWLVVDTTFVMQEEDRRGTPGLLALLAGDGSAAAIGRYDDRRPETARGGDFFQTDARWLVTDSLGLAGELIQSLDDGGVPLWRLGAQLQQTPRFRLRAGYTRLAPLDSELLRYGFAYRLTEKYAVEVDHTIDLGGSGRRFVDVDVERRFPQFSVRAGARFDELRDDTTIGFSLVPRTIR